MTKPITPETIEEAIEWLGSQVFCCHSLASALSGYNYASILTTREHIQQSMDFLEPLFQRDKISNEGTWSNSHTLEALPFTREQWLRKIAQELREGKI
jgi:hypothetical protein